MVVETSPNGKGHALSLFSHIHVLIHGTRIREQRRPILINGELSPLNCDQLILLMGGHRFWRRRNIEGSSTWGDWMAPSPRRVWGCLVSAVFTHGEAANGGLTPPPGSEDGPGDFRSGSRMLFSDSDDATRSPAHCSAPAAILLPFVRMESPMQYWEIRPRIPPTTRPSNARDKAAQPKSDPGDESSQWPTDAGIKSNDRMEIELPPTRRKQMQNPT